MIQRLDSYNPGRFYEAHFNLGHFYYLQRTAEGRRRAAVLWERYLTSMDAESSWAVFAAGRIDFDLAAVLPERRLRLPGGDERWYYDEPGIVVYGDGDRVKRIRSRRIMTH